MVKPFVRTQTWAAMLGYVTKDQAKSHYKIETHNVTAQELAIGRQEHTFVKTNYHSELKQSLTVKNMFTEVFRWNARTLYPVVCPLAYIILYMVQTGIIIY